MSVQVWCFVPLREDVRCILPQGVMAQKSGRGTHNERFCRHEGRDAGARRGGVIGGDYLVQEVVSRVTVPLSGTNIDREA
jgi:hypothetical protein